MSLPWYFDLAKRRLLADRPGAWRLMTLLDRAGLLNRRSLVPFFDDSALWVPLDWQWFWKFEKLTEYEPYTLRSLVQAVAKAQTGPAVFLDCGAHIGLVSHYVTHQCPTIERGWAFEPNPERFDLLSLNAAAMNRPMQAKQLGLSDFTGRARLVMADEDDDGDGAYITPDPAGPIEVTRVDDLGLPADRGVVMKIDVEGAELPILRGAAQALRNAPYFVVLFEAHLDVARRTGIEPMECVRFLNSIRPCRWALSADLDSTLDLDRPFFEQITTHNKRDVIVWTTR